MKFKDFLNSCEDYEGELFADYLDESQHSFSWDKESKFTEKGTEQFKKILNCEIVIIRNGNIRIVDKNITQEEYDLFLNAVAGYVGNSVYEEWFGK